MLIWVNLFVMECLSLFRCWHLQVDGYGEDAQGVAESGEALHHSTGAGFRLCLVDLLVVDVDGDGLIEVCEVLVEEDCDVAFFRLRIAAGEGQLNSPVRVFFCAGILYVLYGEPYHIVFGRELVAGAQFGVGPAVDSDVIETAAVESVDLKVFPNEVGGAGVALKFLEPRCGETVVDAVAIALEQFDAVFVFVGVDYLD